MYLRITKIFFVLRIFANINQSMQWREPYNNTVFKYLMPIIFLDSLKVIVGAFNQENAKYWRRL